MANMPVPQSSKALPFEGHPRNEGWESTMTWWYASSFVLLVAVLGYAPETEIAAWAQAEARARLALKESGQVDEDDGGFEFGKHYQGVIQDQIRSKWDQFSMKAVRMTDEDDDEEEEGEDDED